MTNIYKDFNSAIILAGGKGTRMGFEKQLIEIDGHPLILIIAEKLRKQFEEIIIVTNKPELYKNTNFIVSEDEVSDFGPIAGIMSGLKKSHSQYNFVVACDMPNINIDYANYMIEKIIKSGYNPDVIVTKFGEWLEPFCAFYSKFMIEIFKECINNKQKKISKAIDIANTIYIPEAEARTFSPNWDMFMNINTKEDIKKTIMKGFGGLIEN